MLTQGNPKRDGRWKRIGWLWFLVLGIVLTLGILEGVARFVQMPRPWGPHEILGWAVQPNFHHVYEFVTDQGEPYTAVYETDGDGARRYRAGDGPALSILALGDSFTMDLFVGDAESWYGVLARGLAERYGRAVEVTAVGAPGYGTLQEVLAAEAIVGKRDFDALILQTCVNDFVENSAAWNADVPWRSLYYQRPYASPSDPFAVSKVPGLTAWWYRGPGMSSQLWHKIDQILQSARLGWGISGETEEDRRAEKIARMFPSRPDLHDDALAVTGGLMARARGLVPDRPAFMFTCWAGNDLPLNGQWDRLAQAAGMESIAGVPEAVQAARQRGDDVLAQDAVHWSPRGHALVGGLVLDRVDEVLREEGLLAPKGD